MEQLETELKSLIIEALNLEDIQPGDIDSQAALFGDGLGLDSIDALELGIAVKKKYNVLLENDSDENRKHFASVTSLAEFIQTQKTSSAGV